MSFIGILGALITATLLFKAFFRDMDDFYDCVRYYLTPDIWNILKGEFHQNFFAEGKIFFWLGLSIASGYGVHQIFS